MKQKVRTAIQVIFLLLFIVLIASGKVQMWMVLILGSIVLALGLGRFYCGWLCPHHTLMRPVEWLTQRMGWKRRDVPKWAFSPVLKYSIIAGTVILMIMTITGVLKLPLVVLLVPFALGFTFFYHSSLWHRFLCPFGILLSLTARFAPLRVRVNSGSCTSCTLCTQVCPAAGVNIPAKKEPAAIDSRYCLECFLCEGACPKGAISYTKEETSTRTEKTM